MGSELNVTVTRNAYVTPNVVMSTFPLNCLVLNDDPKRQNFTVEIPETKNVNFLKEKIKEKNAQNLADLDAKVLILWKLDTPIALSRRTDPEIAEDVRAVQSRLPVEVDEGINSAP